MLKVVENSSIQIASLSAELINSTPYEKALDVIEGARGLRVLPD